MFTVTASLNLLFQRTRRYLPSLPPADIVANSLTQLKMSAVEDGYLWSFGYGSNMDVKALETKKHVKIKGKCADRSVVFKWKSKASFFPFSILYIEHTAAILKDWQLSFMPGIRLAEPGYANLAKSPGAEVHGVAFLMSKESQEELDRTESGYAKVFVDLRSYDGRPLKGFVYYNAKASAEGVPSKRYLGVLVKGLKHFI